MLERYYIYDPETCSYKPVQRPLRSRVRSVLKLAALAWFIGTLALVGFRMRYPSMEEIELKRKNQALKSEWASLDSAATEVGKYLREIEQEDERHYRVVLNMDKMPQEIRQGGSGGQTDPAFAALESDATTRNTLKTIKQLRNRLHMQQESFRQIDKQISKTEGMLESRPALQPLDSRHMIRFHPVYGMRLHPIFREWRFHHGLDLTAATGTPVYATGDGVVTNASMRGGYGNVIFLHHGYGFETRYAHLSRFKVTEGQKVKRGEVIGYVGNTGTSTTAHLHYEVLYQGEWINPINFMYRDLTQASFNEIVRSARNR